MKPFVNETDAGSEKAIKRGIVVPEDGINLAYVRAPKLSPEENVVIVDTSRIVEENVLDPRNRRKLYYANSLGVLVDRQGNVVVGDELPMVTDVFSIDEDFLTTPGEEYTDDSILPFVHVSRYFHVDHPGLTLGGELVSVDTQAIKVLDARGREYLDEEGRRRYRIKVTPARTNGTDIDSWAYRVYAYVDTDEHEELYLSYHKVEVTVDGGFKNAKINHRELLNPNPVFEYRPEESEVVDPINRRKKWFSTKPVSLKQQVLGKPHPNVDGYKIYVPKKAIGDPRVFQLFRWRVKCQFIQPYQIDPTTTPQIIRCGIIVTGADTHSRAPYALLNLASSNYNATGVRFQNPKRTSHGAVEQRKAEYWHVNIETDDLGNYDLLLWAPSVNNFDFSPYRAKIEDFVGTKGGTLFIDTNNYTHTTTLDMGVSCAVTPSNGQCRTQGTNSWVRTDRVTLYRAHPVINGLTQLGGWEILDDQNNEGRSISYMQQLFEPGYSQHFLTTPDQYIPVVTAEDSTGAYKAVTAIARVNKGYKILSTFGHLYTCSALFSNLSATLVNENLGTVPSTDSNYSVYVNSTVVEDAMKFLFNIALLSVKNRTLDDSDEQSYSTSWEYSTPWKSSWVINAKDGVLSDKEKADHHFSLQPRDLHAATPDRRPVYKRRLNSRTVKQLIDTEITPMLANPALRGRVEGSTRMYVIEVTNPLVETASYIVDGDYPWAWTEAYTPKFTVPIELGPHIIREQVDEEGRAGMLGQYDSGQYTYYAYPDKPYSGQVFASYAATSEATVRNQVNWTANGTATETIEITNSTPPSWSNTTSDVTLSWWNNPPDANNRYYMSEAAFEWGLQQTSGIATWQEHNYYSTYFGTGIRNWPFWGLTQRYLQGSTGEVVAFIQDFLNAINHLTITENPSGGRYLLPRGSLPIDGNYGAATAEAIRRFQESFNAIYLDGVVDAETWFLIGTQIVRWGLTSGGETNHRRFYDWPWGRITKSHISDHDNGSAFAKRSWVSNGPSIIWEMFMVRFDQEYDIHGVTVVPFLEGATQDMMVRSVDVRTNLDLVNYDSHNGFLTYMPFRPRDGEELYIPFGPYRGNEVIIGVGQDRGAGPGWGTARMLGIRDIRAHARVTTETYNPPVTTITHQSRTIDLTASGSIQVDSFKDVVMQVQASGAEGGSLSNIQWTSVTTDNPDVTSTITSDGKIVFRSLVVVADANNEFTEGPVLPQTAGTYYSMDENGVMNPVPENGFISKADGIKLLCTQFRTPVGFPAMPTGVGPHEYQQHYVKLTLASRGNDTAVQMAFYDRRRKEFIVNAAGLPEMSYLEYIERGPQNVYIAVISEYEVTEQRVLPVDADAPRLPYRWAMPVYGVYTKSGSRITLEPLPKNLGPFDIWPVAVREGRFNRLVNIRSRAEGSLSGWISEYQGTQVRAFYSLPEADRGGYSTRYGPPNADVRDEEPLILDDTVIQVRQPPILMVREPTVIPSDADPVRPVFTVYRRDTRSSPWVAETWPDITDYNASTGEIHLRKRLTSNDASLLKVDYTTTRRSYHLKRVEDTILNLNSYSGHSRDLLGQPIYIYMVPEYVKDSAGRVVADSVQETTLRFTTSSNIFDPIRPEYNPLAVQLGVIYMATALDPRRIAILDTRRRGGGARDGVSVETLTSILQDASTYWDVSYAAGTSYQKGGFVIVRLPVELKEHFSEKEILEVVQRNMTVGVGFKIEDLQGNEWS